MSLLRMLNDITFHVLTPLKTATNIQAKWMYSCQDKVIQVQSTISKQYRNYKRFAWNCLFSSTNKVSGENKKTADVGSNIPSYTLMLETIKISPGQVTQAGLNYISYLRSNPAVS